jgi:EpsI family protein
MSPDLGSFAEPQIDRRKLLLGLLFCSAAGLAVWRQPRTHLDYLGRHKLDDVVPKTIGPWKFVAASGLVVPPEDQLSRMLYSQLLTRVYSDGENPPVMLLIAQSGSQTGVLQVHRPETCYTAGGYQILSLVPHAIQVGSSVLAANAMDAVAEGVTEHVLYWTRVGDRVPASWRDQKIAVAEQNLRGIIPDAILVRVSTVSNDPDAARARLDAFARALVGSVPPTRRSVFIV